jgi:hypothetical protein
MGCDRKDVFDMNARTQQAIELFNGLGDKEQVLAFDMLVKLSEIQESYEREKRNAAFLAKVRRGIEQCATGRGIVHDIVEDYGDA